MKTRKTLDDYKDIEAKLDTDNQNGIFNPGAWMKLVNQMRINGFSVQADEILERIRKRMAGDA